MNAQIRRDFGQRRGRMHTNPCRRGECRKKGCIRCTVVPNNPEEGPDRSIDLGWLTRDSYNGESVHEDGKIYNEALKNANILLSCKRFGRGFDNPEEHHVWLLGLLKHYKACLLRGELHQDGEKMERFVVARKIKDLIFCYTPFEGCPDILPVDLRQALEKAFSNSKEVCYPHRRLKGPRIFDDVKIT